MKDLFEELHSLSQEHEFVRVYPPPGTKFLYRTAGKLPGAEDKELFGFLEHTNGASVLDYCILGCKSRRVPDLATHLSVVWPVNTWMSCMVPFVVSSIGETCGYIIDKRAVDGTHPVVYHAHPHDRCGLVVSSCVRRFLQALIRDARKTLETDPEAVSISRQNWPFNLGDWLADDPELLSLYSSGELAAYWESNAEMEAIVHEALRSMEVN